MPIRRKRRIVTDLDTRTAAKVEVPIVEPEAEWERVAVDQLRVGDYIKTERRIGEIAIIRFEVRPVLVTLKATFLQSALTFAIQGFASVQRRKAVRDDLQSRAVAWIPDQLVETPLSVPQYEQLPAPVSYDCLRKFMRIRFSQRGRYGIVSTHEGTVVDTEMGAMGAYNHIWLRNDDGIRKRFALDETDTIYELV